MQLCTGVLTHAEHTPLCPLHIQNNTFPQAVAGSTVKARDKPCRKLVMQAPPNLAQSRAAAAQAPTLDIRSQRGVREWRQHCWPGLLLHRICSIRR
jgi:hypothetical protein